MFYKTPIFRNVLFSDLADQLDCKFLTRTGDDMCRKIVKEQYFIFIRLENMVPGWWKTNWRSCSSLGTVWSGSTPFAQACVWICGIFRNVLLSDLANQLDYKFLTGKAIPNKFLDSHPHLPLKIWPIKNLGWKLFSHTAMLMLKTAFIWLILIGKHLFFYRKNNK